MIKLTVFLMLLLPVVWMACTTDSLLDTEDELIVVRGYLYSGQLVRDIQLTATLVLGSADTLAPPINDADVTLINGATRFELESTAGDSGYYHYPGQDLEISDGDVFTLEVDYDGGLISGSTRVPPAPLGIALSSETLKMVDMATMWEMRQQGISMDSIRKSLSLTLSWDNENGDLYYVQIDNIEEDPVAVETDFKFPSQFISRPVNQDAYEVNGMQLTHYGRHKVTLYRINQEYADLYESRNQDSRDLNEPLSNIENGLGVFTAFNADSVFFDFIQDE